MSSSALRAGDLGELVGRIRRGELLRVTLGETRWTLVERMQSVMSLIEGHAEHVMDAVGADVLPSLCEASRRDDAAGGRRGACHGACSSACWGSS